MYSLPNEYYNHNTVLLANLEIKTVHWLHQCIDPVLISPDESEFDYALSWKRNNGKKCVSVYSPPLCINLIAEEIWQNQHINLS